MATITTLREAIASLLHDGDFVAMEGFTHLIPFAAGHEVIRQNRQNLTLVRMTPDVVYDQLIGAGCAKKLIFSWGGNPGVGSLHAVRRRIEKHDPEPLEIEEYSHFGMVARFCAGSAKLPFWPMRDYMGIDLWVFRDSNWSPDFPVAARQAISLYTQTRGGTIDGVVALNQQVVEALLFFNPAVWWLSRQVRVAIASLRKWRRV